jgi:hypothetical protein
MRLCFWIACFILVGSLSALGMRAWQCRYHEITGLDAPQAGSVSPADATSADTSALVIRFVDIADRAGIRFHHFAGHSEMHYVPEIMGGGVAWLDYDQDGCLDLFLVQGNNFPVAQTDRSPTSRLYRNQGDGTFTDVTEKVGLAVRGLGQGVAVGDYDNDGYPDLFVTCYGHCHLFHNEPDGSGGRRFRDVTREAGVELDGWCTSCAFGDIHGNGHLDLFVCRYVVMDLTKYPFCGDKGRKPPLRFTCGPWEFSGSSSVLFRNNGNGTFTNVSSQAGIERDGKGLGVVIVDLDDDGKPDIFVGNDEVPNFHYRNLGNGKLESCGVMSGTAANYRGNPMGSMGVDADDLTGRGRPDIFITTYVHEGTTLFRNNGNNLFTDISQSSGMYADSYSKVGWGTCLFDVDRNGDLDLFVANGHVYPNARAVYPTPENGEQIDFAQPAQLFVGDGKGHFRIVTDAGPYFADKHVGRGAAMADFDNDGAMDIAVNNCGEPAALLHNETQTLNHWIRLQLEGSRHLRPSGSNRDAIGAKVTVHVDGRKMVRHVKGGGSYLSSSDRRLLIGLAAAEHVNDIEVRWPNRAACVEHFGPVSVDRSYKLVEGTGQPIDALCPRLQLKH